MEVEEALDKVLVTLKIFNKFRSAFREFKTKLPTYFKEDKRPKSWDFQVQHVVPTNFAVNFFFRSIWSSRGLTALWTD